MYIALGLLSAGMLALLVTPAIWRRATRLTRQRIESSLPLTTAEIEADKDQLRAEFAMTTRRLELTIDRIRETTTEQIFEINEKRAEIVRLANDRNVKIETIKDLEERGAQLSAELKSTNERLSQAGDDRLQAEATLADYESELASLRNKLESEHRLTAGQKLEIAGRGTEIEKINMRLAEAKANQEAIAAERDKLANALMAEQETLAAERHRAENFEASLARMEAERIERLAELERRANDVHALENDLAIARAQATELAARAADVEAERIALLRQIDQGSSEIVHGAHDPATSGRHAENAGGESMPTEEAMLADGDNIAKAFAASEAENAALLMRLAKLESDHAGLRAQNDELRQKISSEREIESENAVLREHLAGVAAEFLRLPQTNAENAAKSSNGEKADNGGEARSDAAPTRLRQPTSVPVIKPPFGKPGQVEEGEPLSTQLSAAPPTATRH